MSCSGLLNDLKRFTSSPPPPSSCSSSSSLLQPRDAAADVADRLQHPTRASSDPARHSECSPTSSSFISPLCKLHLPPHPPPPPPPIPSPSSPPFVVLLCSAPVFTRHGAHRGGRGGVGGDGGADFSRLLLHPSVTVWFFEKGGEDGVLGRVSLLPEDQSCSRREEEGEEEERVVGTQLKERH